MKKKKEDIFNLIEKAPNVVKSITYSRITLDFYDNNAIMFKLDGKTLDWFHSYAKTRKETIDTRTAKRHNIKKTIKDDKCYISVDYSYKNLKLRQDFTLEKNKRYFTVCLTISSDSTIHSNELVPLDFIYPKADSEELFLSLDEKMILVPYDNDMWVHYESSPLKPGRRSYDVSAIYNDKKLNGLLIGALDFDVWKNAIECSGYDARSFKAVSGVADSSTHDLFEHSYLSGKQISSSRFICGYYTDIRNGLKEYGKLAKNNNGIYKWKHGVPFGWNSYSALTLDTTIKHVNNATDFIYKNLPNFKSEDGVTYINFDAVINIDKNDIIKLINKLHSRGQKVGWYMNPLSHLKALDNVPLLGSENKYRKDIVLKQADGSDYPPIDNKYPIDITIPEAEIDFRLSLREFVLMGFDYIKLDFLSHGAVEGKRYKKDIVTGRQALMYFYEVVKEELDPEKINKEIFISSSIDPLFPCGYSHSRRSSCDAFGHHEDNRYVLNSLNYGFWINNTLYQFNDPDHTVLYHSLVDGRSTTSENEARSRYNTSVISGTVMLLSDNYGPGSVKHVENAKKRAFKFANNKKINDLARLNKAFTPLYMNGTSEIYYLNDKNKYLAVFNFEDKTKSYEIKPKDVHMTNKGILLDLNTNKKIEYDKTIRITLKPYDSRIYILK